MCTCKHRWQVVTRLTSMAVLSTSPTLFGKTLVPFYHCWNLKMATCLGSDDESTDFGDSSDDSLYSPSSESDEDDELLEPASPPRLPPVSHSTQPWHHTRKDLRSLSDALDSTNYDPHVASSAREFSATISALSTVTWTSKQPARVGRQGAQNIIHNAPGVQGEACDAATPVKAFNLFVTDEMLDMIVYHTNQRIRKKQLTSYYSSETDKLEIRALIGLCFARGLLGQNLQRTGLLYKDKYGHHIFSATMAKNHLKFLMSNLGFDDEETRSQRYHQDRFAACRELFEVFNVNCRSHFVPDDFLAVDETLYPCRNKVSIKQYNKSKPAKYGILFKSLNAVRVPFTFTTSVYAGKPPAGEGPYYVQTVLNQVKYLVNNIQQTVSIQGRNISLDRHYTSIDLANWLLSKKITMIGTLQTNRKGIPKEIKDFSSRDENTYKIYWNKAKSAMTLHSYVVCTKSTGKRNVLVLSTFPPIIGTTKDKKKKPAIMKVYDFTKGGTDIMDQKMSNYSTRTKSKKWTRSAFSYILDTARINAQTIYAANIGRDVHKLDSHKFGWELARELVLPFMEQRSLAGLHFSVKQKMSAFMGKPLESIYKAKVTVDPAQEQSNHPRNLSPAQGRRRRCTFCIDLSTDPKSRDNISATPRQCQLCKKPVCQKHSIIACKNCV